ncbi:MAG: pyruvate kinase [Gemmatimonadetes bacterium]|nr:pyruvate kinase [Gemmatimonadota bacterium]
MALIEHTWNRRKTRIIATVGPGIRATPRLRALIEAGVDVFRLNMSHGSYASHGSAIRRIRGEADAAGRHTAILLDLPGPKIRLGEMQGGSVLLRVGAKIAIDSDVDRPGTRRRVAVNWPGLLAALDPGARLLLDDGNIELMIDSATPSKAWATVVRGGPLSSRKGVTLPGATAGLTCLTDKDRKHLEFGIRAGVDWIAISFVNEARDVREVRRLVDAHGANIPLLAKIETALAVSNLASILDAADGVMVARGDLGIETPIQELPLVQKRIIRLARASAKPVVVATQILESMIEKAQPTRAEITDIANAVLDGADALMLSAETAVGAHPVAAVTALATTARRVESATPRYHPPKSGEVDAGRSASIEAFGIATRAIARSMGAEAILAMTASGRTAANLARFLPEAPVVAGVPEAAVARRLAVVRGVFPIVGPSSEDESSAIEMTIELAQKEGLIEAGDLLVITAGLPIGEAVSTNTISVQIAGGFYLRGHGAGARRRARGRIVRLVRPQDGSAQEDLTGKIVLAKELTAEQIRDLPGCSGAIAERGGAKSPAARACEETGVPAVIGVASATEKLDEGTLVVLDTERGLVRVARNDTPA